MDQIRGRLEFVNAEIESLTFTPAERDPTASLVLSADFSPEIAAVMRVRDSFYPPGGDKPYFGPTRVDLGEKKLRDIELILPMADNPGDWDTYVPEQINGFRVDRDAQDAPVLRLHMRVRIQGRYEELAAFLRATNKESFDYAIRSRQTEFDWTGAATGTALEMGATGSKVAGKAERSGPLFQQPELAACDLCDREVPRNEDGYHMKDGTLIPCPRPAPPSDVEVAESIDRAIEETAERMVAVEPTTGPVIASESQMGIRRRRKDQERPRPTAEQIDENLGATVQ
jgi:hypothetical protein